MDTTSCDPQEPPQVTLSIIIEQPTMEMKNDDVNPKHSAILQSSSTPSQSLAARSTSSAISPESLSVMDATMAELLEKSIFNCKFCGNFFKTPVFAVQGHGTVCEICCKAQQWKGGRLEIYEVILKNLRIVPCARAGDNCGIQVLPPETAALPTPECNKYRPIECVSPDCPWRGEQDEFTDHFLNKHRRDVVNLSTALDLAQESFVIVKLLIKNSCKYLLIRQAPAEIP